MPRPMNMFYSLQETAAPQPANGDGSEEAPSGGGMSNILIMVVLMVVMFWFLMGGQRKEKKRREIMLANLKRNDHIVTTGGILGVVDRIKDNEVIVKIDEKNDLRIRVVRAAIAYVKGDSAEPAKPGADEGPAKEK